MRNQKNWKHMKKCIVSLLTLSLVFSYFSFPTTASAVDYKQETIEDTYSWDFSDASQKDDFEFYNQGSADQVKIDGGFLKTVNVSQFSNVDGVNLNTQKKMILDSVADVRSISVDIHKGGALQSEVIVGVKNISNTMNCFDGLGILVESVDSGNPERIALRLKKYTATGQNPDELKVYNLQNSNNNALYTDGSKEPLRLTVDIKGSELYITVTLISDPTKSFTAVYNYSETNLDLQKGAVGFLARWDYGCWDNLSVTTNSVSVVKTKTYDFTDPSQKDDFEFYNQGSAEQVKIDGGFLKTVNVSQFSNVDGVNLNEQKKMILDSVADVRSLSVDIHKGEGLQSEVIVGVKNISNTKNCFDGLGILVESVDASNPERIALRLKQYTATGNVSELKVYNLQNSNNNALYTDGSKEPLRLTVDIQGSKLYITVTLISDSTKSFTTVYEYTAADLKEGAVGLLARWAYGCWDNLSVTMNTKSLVVGGSDSNTAESEAVFAHGENMIGDLTDNSSSKYVYGWTANSIAIEKFDTTIDTSLYEAKFVDRKMLKVGMQTKVNAENSDLVDTRYIASLNDNLGDYKKAGFLFATSPDVELSLDTAGEESGKCKNRETTVVYEQIYADGVMTAAKDIYNGDAYSKYIFAHEFSGMPQNQEMYVKAYVILADDTVVYGETCSFNVSE